MGAVCRESGLPGCHRQRPKGVVGVFGRYRSTHDSQTRCAWHSNYGDVSNLTDSPRSLRQVRLRAGLIRLVFVRLVGRGTHAEAEVVPISERVEAERLNGLGLTLLYLGKRDRELK